MTTQPDSAARFDSAPDQRRSRAIGRDVINAAVVFALSIVLILCSRFVSPALGSWSQVLTVLTLASFLVVLSFGQGLVILVGGLDLSIPSVITLGGVLTTMWVGAGDGQMSIVLLPAILLVCALVGMANGMGVVFLKVPPFIMTMATSIIAASVALGYTSGTPRGASPEVLVALMKASFAGIPLVVWFLVLFSIGGWLIQSRTTFGRRLFALGSSREAARIAGVPVGIVEMLPYAISAACAGFVGMMLVGYANGATLRMGDNYMLPSIAAVVIGGSSILGGSGSFVGTVGGAILLTTLGTVIAAVGIDQGWRTVIEGGIILGALLLLREDLFSRFRRRRG
jgi:ribose transport system permease protein